jgi:myosin heavy subunit
MADSYKNSIKLGIALKPTSEVQNELNSAIQQLEKNSSIDLKIDTKQINQSLKDFSETLNSISNQMKNGFNLGSVFNAQASSVEGVTNKLKEEQQAIEQTANTMKILSSTKIGNSDSNGNITETLKTVEQLQEGIGKTTRLTTDLKTGLNTATNTENFQKLENIVDNLQNKLNKSSNNKFVNESVITELQNKLNGINTNTAEKEIKELQTTINNLGSSDNQIVRLQSTISKMESSLTLMKSKYGSLVGDNSSKSSLDAYVSEIEKLKTLMASLQNGGTISGQKLASELNLGTEASRNLSNSVKNSSSALKLAQQDANSFGGTLSKVLSNAGIYMGAYQGIQMLTNAVKDGAKYVEYLNASFTDMKMTMDISESGFTKLSSEIDEMGKKIGAVSTDMHDIARVYANANTSADEIMQKVKSASELSNISGMSGVDTTKSMQSVINQFKLMSQEGATASSVTQHVGDVLTTVSRNMQYDFADGIKQVNEAIKTSGSVAETAGVSLESYASMAGAFIQQTGKTGLNLGSV